MRVGALMQNTEQRNGQDVNNSDAGLVEQSVRTKVRCKRTQRKECVEVGNTRSFPVVLERLYGSTSTLLPLRLAVAHLAKQVSNPQLIGQLERHLLLPGAHRLRFRGLSICSNCMHAFV